MGKSLLWTIEPDAPEEFFESLRGVDLTDLNQLLPVLIPAHQKGWVTILGSTDRNAKDIAAVLQEFMIKVKVITPEDLK